METFGTWFSSQWQPRSDLRSLGALPCRVPRLGADDLRKVAKGLREARERDLRHRPVGETVALVDAAARLWGQPDYPLRREAEAMLPRVTGYSQPVIAWGLDALFASLRREALLLWLQEELGHPGVLDRFHVRREAPGRVRALGPDFTTHFLAGNIPGLGVQAMVQSLLVKSACLLKLAEGEPVLAPLFAETLAELEPRVASCVAAFWWPGGTEELDRAAIDPARVVTATGDDATIEALRAQVPPHVRFVAHGHKVSFGVVDREHVTPETARAAARDAALYDQQGCLSPHLYYVEVGGPQSAWQFAEWLAEALREIETSLPSGPRDASDYSTLHQLRAAWELRGASLWPQALEESASFFTVILDQAERFELSCLKRVVFVKPLRDLSRLMSPQPDGPQLHRMAGRLQAVSLAVSEPRRTRLAEGLAELGVSRLCPFGTMQDPPLWWYQDGRPGLLDLLRFSTLEDA